MLITLITHGIPALEKFKIVNPTRILDFLVIRAGSHVNGDSINGLLILGGKVTPGDFLNAERFLTIC